MPTVAGSCPNIWARALHFGRPPTIVGRQAPQRHEVASFSKPTTGYNACTANRCQNGINFLRRYREPRAKMERSPINICTGVSQYLFRLATESVRLYSNKVGSVVTLDDAVNGIAHRASTIVHEYGSAAVKEHYRIIPTYGSIPIYITILESNAPSYTMAAEMLSSMMLKHMDIIDAVSIALFDLVAEQEVAQLASKLGISPEAATDYRNIIRQSESNVVSFR